MYYIYGVSGPSLLIESTDLMIYIQRVHANLLGMNVALFITFLEKLGMVNPGVFLLISL